MERCEVVVVGGRLAGACAAAHLAKAGRRVLVLDKMTFPSDQLSTHLLFPAGVEELRRMGALEGILANDPTKSPWVELGMPDGVHVRERWRKSGEIDYCMCVPRTMQDVELVRAARAAGADVREKCSVLSVRWRAGRACGVSYRDPDGDVRDVQADLVIGADGRRSTTASEVGAFEPYRASRNGRGLVFRYLDDPLFETVAGQTIYQWRDGDSFAMAFPSAPRGRILALFMGAAEEASEARGDAEGYWERKLAQHPRMAERLAGAGNPSKLRSTGDTTAFFRASSGPGWALLGDAGHFKDPVIGQGQRDALWTGRELAEAVSDRLQDHPETDAALRRWEAERDRECLSAYHFGNIDTEVEKVPPVLVEVLRRTSRDQLPDVSDLFGRARSLPQVVTLPRMQRGLLAAIGRGSHGPPTRLVADALPQLRTHIGIRTEALAGRFRSTRLVPGSDHPHPHPPKAPRNAGPEPARPEAEAVAA